ncbi:hypothetical protein HK102_012874 [Quaeritorhiza haematococci]|nr:hypothetical protein HK102_012874 [Quaeritorhiza haematococci]
MENITNDAATAAVNISIANEAEFASRVEVNTNKFLRFHEDLTHIQTACQHASENVATIEREAERDDQTLKGLVSSLAVLQEKIVALEGKKAEEETRCEQEEKILQHYRTVLEAMDGIRSISDKETDADAEIRTKATQQLAAAEKRYALLTSVLSQTKGELQQADTESIAIKEQIQRIEARAAELDQLQSSLQALNKNLDIGIKYLTKFEYFLDGWENYRATMSVFTNSDSDADDGRQPSPTAAVSPPAATAGTVAATFGSNNGTPSPAISATSTTPTTESEPATPPATSKAETPTSTTPTTESGPATPPATSKAETATSTTPTIESGPATPPASSKAKAAAPNIKPAPFGHPPRPRIAASATSTTASVPVNTFTNKTTTPNITPVPSTWTARPPAAASVPATSPPSRDNHTKHPPRSL